MTSILFYYIITAEKIISTQEKNNSTAVKIINSE